MTTFERRLLLLALLALVLRVGYIALEKRDGDACGQTLCGDAIYYSAQANHLADGRGFDDPFRPGQPAADHPPLTALVAAPASLLTGDRVGAQRLTMALVGVAAVVTIGMLGRRVANERVGLLAAGGAALYPNLWVNDGLVMSEALTTLLVAAVLLALYRFWDQPSGWRVVAVGALSGLAMLARAEQALLVPVVAAPVVWWAPSPSTRTRLTRLAILAVTAGLVVTPWVVRNLVRFDRPVFLSTNDGLTLAGANCDDVYHGGSTGLWSLECALRVPAHGDQSQVSATWRRAAFDYIGDHTGRVPAVMAIRVARSWSLWAPDQMVWYNVGEGRERWVSWAGLASYAVLGPLAVAGGVILRRRRALLWPLGATAVVVTVTAALFYGILRFRIPAEVAIVVLAAVAVDGCWRRVRPGPLTPAT